MTRSKSIVAGNSASDAVVAAAEQRVSSHAVEQLEKRAHSVNQLRQKLLARERASGSADPTAVVEVVIKSLLAKGDLDDRRYSIDVARARVLQKGFSKRSLEQDLVEFGIDRDVARDAIATVLAGDDPDPDAAMVAMARKKLQSLASLDEATRRRRLKDFLARKGYEPDAVREVLESLLPE